MPVSRSGRGRDDRYGSPPAQIRTSAFTHTALLKDRWRGSEPEYGLLQRTPSRRWVMHIPAQSQEHVRLNGVFLQLRPSLPDLRRKLPSLVRPDHRYYGAVRPLQHVHVRRTALGLHGPAFAICRRRTGDLPVLVHVVLSACTGSNDYAGPVNCSRVTQPPYCLPPTRQGVGILIRGFSKLNHPAHRCLDLRFATHLAMCHARLEVRMDSLFPFLQGLAPLQHVGLSRRTAYYRLSGHDLRVICVLGYVRMGDNTLRTRPSPDFSVPWSRTMTVLQDETVDVT